MAGKNTTPNAGPTAAEKKKAEQQKAAAEKKDGELKAEEDKAEAEALAAAKKTETKPTPNSNGFRFRSTVRNMVIQGNSFADFVFVARTKDVADQIRSSGEFGRRVFQDSA